MRKAGAYFLFTLLGTFLISASFMATIMWGHTGSPGEQTCVACHNSFPLNSGAGVLHISSVPLVTGNKYVAGQTYTINVTVLQSGISTFACDAEVLDSLGNNSGTISSIQSNAPLQTYLPNGRKNIFGNLTQNDSAVFSFKWVAPFSGEANIYVTGIAANGNEASSGDYVYSDSLLHLKVVSGVGIKTEEEKNKFSIHPNPTRGYFEIDNESEEKDAYYIITDVAGKQLHEGKIGGAKTKIDVSGFVNGIYGVEVISNGKTTSKKIIIVQ